MKARRHSMTSVLKIVQLAGWTRRNLEWESTKEKQHHWRALHTQPTLKALWHSQPAGWSSCSRPPSNTTSSATYTLYLGVLTQASTLHVLRSPYPSVYTPYTQEFLPKCLHLIYLVLTQVSTPHILSSYPSVYTPYTQFLPKCLHSIHLGVLTQVSSTPHILRSPYPSVQSFSGDSQANLTAVILDAVYGGGEEGCQ